MTQWKRRFTWVGLLGILIALWCVPLSIDREYDRDRGIGEGLVVRETIHVDRRPYTPLGHAGEIWIPVPMAAERVARQSLLHNGTLIWQGPIMNTHAEYEKVDFHVSPNRKYVLLVSTLHDQPWKFIKVDTAAIAEVSSPGRAVEGHHFGYPFEFRKWEDNSEYVLATVTGSDLSPKHMIRFSSSWRIRASDGSYDQIERTEKPL